MVRYRNITEGIFHERLHRFGAVVSIEGSREYVHVKNTGRCREILLPGSTVFLEKSDKPVRKTRYSIVSAYKGNMLINIDSQVPNRVVEEAIVNGYIGEFADIRELKRERTYGRSRFDLYFERYNGARGFIEVKGVTLDVEGTAMFPDAPTARGVKHLNELVAAKGDSYEAWVMFLIQYKPVKIFTPNNKTDPGFAETLIKAADKGVRILAYDSIIQRDSISIGSPVLVKLGLS